jgi:ParB family chromosome partitioning protein
METTQLMTNGNLTAETETLTKTVANTGEIKLLGEAKMNQKTVEIKDIKFDMTETFDTSLVYALASSINAIGLLNPIIITPDFQLVAGRLRLLAYKRLGYETIPASIVTLGEMQQRLATIDENLMRKRLTRYEEAKHLAERKVIYEALFPQTRHGVAGALAKHNGSAVDILSFAADTAKKTGETVRNVNRKIEIYEKLSPAVHETIEDSAIAKSFTEMRMLGECDAETQVKLMELICNGKAKTVKAANCLLDTPVSFAKDKGDFNKSLAMARKAFEQMINEGEVKSLFDRLTKNEYDHMKNGLFSDLESLRQIKKQAQLAIKIMEKGFRKFEMDAEVIDAKEQELALAV